MAVAKPEVTWETCPADGCQGARVGAQGGCLAHMPAQELRQLLSPSGRPVDLDGRGVELDRESFGRLLEAIPLRSDRRWLGAVRFDGATFRSEATFDSFTFTGQASFAGATFTKDARFGGASFRADAFFVDALFQGESWFIASEFHARASFARANLTGHAWIQQAAFRGGAWFDGAVFSQNAIFSSTTFSSTASFSGAAFSRHAMFKGTTFEGPSTWQGTSFASVQDRPAEAEPAPATAPPPPTSWPVLLDQPAKAPPRRPAGRERDWLRILVPLVVLTVVAGLSYVVLRPEPDSASINAPAPSDPGSTVASQPAGSTASSAPPGSAALATPGSDGRAESYAIMLFDPAGPPVRFDPCRPVRFVVNTAGAPAGYEAALREAVGEVTGATGITFEDGGLTDERVTITAPAPGAALEGNRSPYQPRRYPPDRWAPVLIQWTDLSDGTHGAYIGGTARADPVVNSEGLLVYVSGIVVMSPRTPLAMLKGAFMHELGHIIGLDHVKDRDQVMTGEARETLRTTWGAGDRTGLRLLGREAGCLETPAPR